MARPILIVDDSADDRELLLEALKSAGVTQPLEQVGDGRQALARLAAAPLPCLVLLDIKMPYADGFEVLAKVRADPALRMLQVVMLTGSAQPRDVERAYRLGVNAFLVKPPSLDRLIAMMAAVKAFWLGFNLIP